MWEFAKNPLNIFRPYLKVIYGTFTSIEEYERWRNTLIDAKNSKKGRRIKYRDIPELDIYFFKLKIPLPILNTYNSFYLAFWWNKIFVWWCLILTNILSIKIKLTKEKTNLSFLTILIIT
ncbi:MULTISPECIES: hypothetical protein [unclassified Spiroplasma]|uniref:hypothetical protein n=1 Tax=unclassified Spiroplasma TaxID=2637901 RepID=UPI00313D5F7A